MIINNKQLFTFKRVLYEYWNQDSDNIEEGNTYNEDYDKFLGIYSFENINQAIEFVKRGIIKKGHKINEIDDISENYNFNEIVIFYGKDIIKDGIRFERAIKIESNDNIVAEYTLKSLLFNNNGD